MSTSLVAQNLTEQVISKEIGKHSNIIESLDANYFYQLAQQHRDLEQIEFMNFIHKCILFKADPRKNEIYLIPRSQSYKDHEGNWKKKQVATIVLSYQFFLKKAYESGDLDFFKVETNVEDYFDITTMQSTKTLVSTCHVRRKSSSDMTSYKARFHEFASKDYNGNINSMWKNKPYLMLEKCAIANAMRQAFPSDLTGVYVQEEILDSEYTSQGEKVINEAARIEEKTEKELEGSEVRKAMRGDDQEYKSQADIKIETNPESDQKEKIIDEIKNLIGSRTEGFKHIDKLKTEYAKIGVTSFDEIKNKDHVELITLLTKLKKKR